MWYNREYLFLSVCPFVYHLLRSMWPDGVYSSLPVFVLCCHVLKWPEDISLPVCQLFLCVMTYWRRGTWRCWWCDPPRPRNSPRSSWSSSDRDGRSGTSPPWTPSTSPLPNAAAREKPIWDNCDVSLNGKCNMYICEYPLQIWYLSFQSHSRYGTYLSHATTNYPSSYTTNSFSISSCDPPSYDTVMWYIPLHDTP